MISQKQSFRSEHRRVTFGAKGLASSTSTNFEALKILIKTFAAVDEAMQWAQGYSGCVGVSINGSQERSGSVTRLPSSARLRMAVTGR